MMGRCAPSRPLFTLRSGRIATAATLIAMIGGLVERLRNCRHIKSLHSTFSRLVEINTVSDTGDTARAADAMAARLRSARFTARRYGFQPAPRKGNLVAAPRAGAKNQSYCLLLS